MAISTQRWTTAIGRHRDREAPARRETPASGNEYADLKRRIVAAGLLERQPRFYGTVVAITLAAMAASVIVAAMTSALWILLLDAAVLGVVFSHLAFLGHDSGHHQVFSKSRDNRRMQAALCFVLGVSMSWWVEKHNKHHSFPNAPDADPDVDIPVIAFSEEDAMARRGPLRFFIKYQSFLFFPILALEGFGLRLASTMYLMQRGTKRLRGEVWLVAAHFVVYGVFVFAFMPWAHAVLFIVVHHMVVGVYLGSIFAPNHKGMEMIGQDEDVGFLRRQVLTSRNVAAHPVTDILYGGLNFQIEHHLFPSMPRNKLPAARPIVMEFLRERNIPYYETSMFGSYREILSHLHQVSAPLRRGAA